MGSAKSSFRGASMSTRPKYENDEPFGDPMIVLDLLKRGWNDNTVRTVERWPHAPPHVLIVHCHDFSDNIYIRFLVTAAAVDQLIAQRWVSGAPKWGYTENRELHITQCGETHLYNERARLGEFPRADNWLERR